MKKLKHLLFTLVLCLTSLVALFAFVKAPTEVNAAVAADSLASLGSSEKLDMIVDQYSLSDLTIQSTSGMTSLPNNGTYRKSTASFTFSEGNVNKNIIFRFKYNVTEANNDLQTVISFDTSDDAFDYGNMKNMDNHILLNSGIHIRRYSGGAYGYKDLSGSFDLGLHEIEFGRIAILDSDGVNTGNYYVYVKVDKVQLRSDKTPYDLSKMGNSMFLYYSSKNAAGTGNQNTIYDMSYNADAETYEVADEISISDLTYLADSSPVGNFVTLDANKKFAYTSTAEHKSVIFKFKYEVINPSSLSHQFHFADRYSEDYSMYEGTIWLKNNDTNIRTGNGTYTKWNCGTLTTPGMYNVELGKIYVTSGTNSGKYWIYVKVEGNIYIDMYASSMPDKANIFTTGDNGDKLYDISYGSEQYEDADEISIADLSYGGNPVGNTATLDAQKVYSYTATAEHKSVVYKFKYATDDISNVSCQFHFADGWSEGKGYPFGMVWLTTNNTYLRYDSYIEDGKTKYRYLETHSSPFASAGIYTVELGKKYVTNGTNAGKYYVYVKVEDSLLLDYYVDSMQDKANLFLTGTGGGFLYDIDYTPCGVTHQAVLEHHAAQAATCTASGNVEYWYCSNCDKYFSDSEGTIEINDITIAMLSHTFGDLQEEVPATCTVAGVKEHKDCTLCGKHFDNDGVEIADLAIAALGHDLIDDAAVAPTCTTAGHEAGHHCSRCDYTDGGATIAALGHDLIDDAAVAATCTETGKTAGHHCSRCDYTDGGETVEALGHNYEWVVDEAPTYSETGLKHEECTRCHDKRNENTVIPVLSCDHDLELTQAVPATCTAAGSKAYYTCSVCGKHFSDAEGLIEIDNLAEYLPVPALGHDLIDDAAVAATCTEAGKEAGHHCSRCDYTDGGATIAALGHDLIDDAAVAPTCTETGKTAGHHCSRCDYTDGGETVEALGHDLIDDAAVAPTCTEAGKEAGKHCSRCDYTEGGATIPAHHTLVHHDAVAPTLEENGNIEYWECSVCGKKFSDAAGTVETNNIATTLEEGKVISIADLKKSGNPVGYVISNKETQYTYDNEDHKANYSLVFKLQYVVNAYEHKQNGDEYQNQFHLTRSEDKWASASTFILNTGDGQKVHIGKSTIDKNSDGFMGVSYSMSLGTIYEVEYGRLAIVNGESFTGKYLTYLKINGELVASGDYGISPDVVQGNLVFVVGGGANTLRDISYVPDTYEEADVISVKDLKENGIEVGSVMYLDKDTKYAYTATAQHKSVVFKFKYDCADPSKVGCQIHFADGYSESSSRQYPAGMIWLRNDATFIRTNEYGQSAQYIQSAAPSFALAGRYNVEVGKLYVANGTNAGKYYIYIKIEDTLILEMYANGMQDVANIFLTGKNGDFIYDKDYVQDVFEEADQVSIGDLKFEGKAFGNVAKLNADKNYTYTATAEHKSVVYKFKYEIDDLSKVSCQFHFADRYSENPAIGLPAGMIWLTENTIYLRVGDGEYISRFNKDNKPFAEPGTYSIELGKLYVTEGTNAGKYYVYLKIEGKLILYRYVDELADMANLFLTGKQGGRLLDIDFVPCNGVHTLEHVEGVAATCTEAGTKEYWWCTNCGEFFSDAEGENPIADLAEYLPIAALGHDLIDDAAVAATCTEAGKTAGHHCSRCDYTDGGETVEALGHNYEWVVDKEATAVETGLKHEECTRCHDKRNENTVIEKIDHDHQLVKTDAVAPTCTVQGAKAYYTCSVCGKHFSDAAGQLEIDNLEEYLPVPALGHDLIDDAAVAPTCTETGKTAGHHCSRCDYTDGGETIPANGHTFGELIAEVPATCTEAGTKAHKDCSVCHKHFDAQGNEIADLTIPAKGHTFGEMIAEVAATCTEAGTKAHKDCSVCGKHFDAEGNEIADLTIPAGHTFGELIAEVPATCTEAGTKAHKDCSVCNKHFDAEGNEIADLTIPASHTLTHHDAVPATCRAGNIEYWECSVCSKKFSDAAGTTEVADVTLAPHHTLTKVDAKPATCTEAGNVEYYHCSECGKNFSDAAGTKQISSAVIPATGHTYGEDGKCTVCGEADPDYVPPKKKGCKSSIGAIAVLFPTLVIGVAAVAIRKRKER